MIIQNIINGNLLEINPGESHGTTKKRVLKNILWALSNLALCTTEVVEKLLEDDTVDIVIDLVNNPSFAYTDVFAEAMYFICNLVNSCTRY